MGDRSVHAGDISRVSALALAAWLGPVGHGLLSLLGLSS